MGSGVPADIVGVWSMAALELMHGNGYLPAAGYRPCLGVSFRSCGFRWCRFPSAVCWLDLMLGSVLCMATDIFLCPELQDYIQFATIAANSTIFIIASGSGWVRRWIYTVLYLYMYNVT